MRLAVDKHLSGAITTLTLISGPCPEDLFYTARKGDHEGNGNMASNTSDEDGDVPAVTPSNYVGLTCANKKIFRVVSLNVQSMNNKFDEIRVLADSTGAAILAIQEMWFRNPSMGYSIKGYQQLFIVTRKDGGSNSGGGVGLWISENITYNNLNVKFLDQHCEMQAVYLPNKNTIILNVYRPFGDLNIFFAMLEETLEQFAESHPNSDLTIVGDFNIDLQRSSSITNRLIELTILNDLVQHVTIPTRISVNHRSIIDHVYIRSRRIMQTDVIMTTISDHFATITKIQDFKRDSPKTKVTKRWFTPETYEYLCILLRHENWTPRRDLNCTEATDFLIDKITEALDLLAPVETK